MRKHWTAAQRAELIALVTAGELSVREAATQIGVGASTAYAWLAHKGRRSIKARASGSAIASPNGAAGFAQLVRVAPSIPMLLLRIGSVVVELRAGFDPVLLREVVAALEERSL